MPELPEVETVVRSLAPHLPGRRILSAEFDSRFVTPGNRRALAAKFAGRTIRGIRRRGKFIVVALDQGSFSVHLGMTGKLLLDGARGEHTHGVFTLDHGVLLYDDPRQFGRIEWNPRRIARLGPEPLEIGADEFVARLRARKSRVKALLMNQSFLAGMGNIYVDEALFASGIHPLAIASRLSGERAARLHQAIRETLTLAIEHRGSSISDYVDAAGERGNFQVLHRVYGREGEPCLNCGAAIRKIVFGQRGTHFCPRCQRK
ncbi:MAG TPA: bifunctional DNA-formamidopyrimidine glycosylase/DNA-(apurinic or apyrimidinic site) lyase [Bryobacteraceae bacterium]|nr:bifunctional DNA-formamidopyrimidine glycosylase/DNA-(apurinic or apyrimidinic site) lyase [Bryobacteraceae bacterium]